MLLLSVAVTIAAQTGGSAPAAPAQATTGVTGESAQQWADDAVRNQVKVIESSDQVPVRFRQRRVSAKGDLTREVIESKDGNVARLVERDGQPITAAEDAAERARLQDDLASPNDVLKRHRRDVEMRDSVVKLVSLMPQAMLYSFAPEPEQKKASAAGEVVLDFRPNPAFHPPTMYAEALTGLEGRVWIDCRSHTLTHIEARVLHPVNFGFGVLAKIYPGGTLEMEQTNVGGHWMYSRVDEHLTARLLMVKSYPENNEIRSWDFRMLPSLLSYQDSIRILLAMQIPLR